MTATIHLLVIVHGLWGSKENVKALGEAAIARCAPDSTIHYSTPAPLRSRPRATSKAADTDVDGQTAPTSSTAADSNEVKLVVLSTSGNEGTQTYDGIDTCAYLSGRLLSRTEV